MFSLVRRGACGQDFFILLAISDQLLQLVELAFHIRFRLYQFL
jgi:hypothetical protein